MLEVDRIKDVVWNTEAFSSLVIDPTAKTLVQAVVTNQIHAQDGTDLIQGKGNGLFILLHGYGRPSRRVEASLTNIE